MRHRFAANLLAGCVALGTSLSGASELHAQWHKSPPSNPAPIVPVQAVKPINEQSKVTPLFPAFDSPQPLRESDFQPIDLGSALRLAVTNNYDVLAARQVVEQATALRNRALAQWLPNLVAGSTYLDHDGRIQQANGNIINANRNSVGVAAGPQFAFQLTDAIFGPLAARQILRSTEAGVQRVTNDTLLAVADACIGALRARRRLARVDDTLDALSSEKASPSRGKSKGLLPLIKDIVEVGGRDAYLADVYRVHAEVLRRQDERSQILQDLRIANSELARLIRLDPAVPLLPIEDFRRPLPIPCAELLKQKLDGLLQLALQFRPELAENQALLQAAEERLRAARMRPYLPTIGASWLGGGFGGGPARNTATTIVDPLSGPINPPITATGIVSRFGHRSDLEVGLSWRLPNGGVGNLTEIREQQALLETATIRLLQMRDRVMTQVIQAHEAMERGHERIDIARKSLFDDKNEPQGPIFQAIRLNFERIRGAEGRPLEVIDAIRGLNDMLEAYANALSDWERAEFRLLIALGVPEKACLYPAEGNGK